MRLVRRPAALPMVACIAAALVAACGGSSGGDNKGTPARAAHSGGKITVEVGVAPDSLDPQIGNNQQSLQVNWEVHLGLLGYAHKPGARGFDVIPALAEALPAISSDRKTYTFKLRPGLVYSDGTPVKAGDFAYTVERALKLNWGGQGYIVGRVAGAAAYDNGKAGSISGISTDDAARTITIRLTAPYGALASVLALPAFGLVPGDTPMKSTPTAPGVGPYMLAPDPQINDSFALVKNPRFAELKIPGVPVGNLDTIQFKINANNGSAAAAVLDDRADIFDAHDIIPAALLGQVRAKASDRYRLRSSTAVLYFWMNVTTKPFDDVRVRRAVAMAIDRRALARLSSGQMTTECFFLPKGFPGHPDEPCPWTDASGAPKLAEARQLIRQAGAEGAKVTVWGQQRSPRKEWVVYAATALDAIGLDATVKTLADSVYYTTVGAARTKAQMGTSSFEAAFPDPYALYLGLDPASIQTVDSYNLARANDKRIAAGIDALKGKPISDPATVKAWRDLDSYATQQAYHDTFGTLGYPQFFSSRLVFSDATFHPLFANDWALLRLKG